MTSQLARNHQSLGMLGVVLTLNVVLLAVEPATAQQISGVPGSPSATVTIDGKQIPAPPMKFGGVIDESAKSSKPYWPPRLVPPKGAPNVLLIMTDDQGYGVSGTFGGVIPTRPSATPGQTEFTDSGAMPGIPLGSAPSFLNKSYTITAEIEVPPGGGEGIIVTEGGRFGGFGFYLLKGKPVFTWNLLALARERWEAPDALAAGKHTLAFDFRYDGPGIAKGGTGVLKVDGKDVVTQKMPRTIPFLLPADETFDVGVDSRTGVDDRDYQVPFSFTGKLTRLTVKLDPPQLAAADKQRIDEAVAKAKD